MLCCIVLRSLLGLNLIFPSVWIRKIFCERKRSLKNTEEKWVVLTGSRTVKCPFETWQLSENTKPTHSCGTFGKVGAKLRWASGQHNPAKKWMWDDLNGSWRQLLFLLLARQLHHLLHETHTVLCSYSTHRLGVHMPEWERRERGREKFFKSEWKEHHNLEMWNKEYIKQFVQSLAVPSWYISTTYDNMFSCCFTFKWWHRYSQYIIIHNHNG